MELRFHWQTEMNVQSLAHVPEGGLSLVPVGVVDEQAAQDEGMVLRVVPSGVAAFIDVEEVHASLETGPGGRRNRPSLGFTT